MAYDTLANVKSIVLFRGDEPTDGTSDWDAETDNILIEVWRDLTVRHPWLSLIKDPPGVFLTVAPITTTTITIATAGTSVTVTFSAAPAASITGYRIQPSGKPYFLRVTAHTAAALTATIDAAPETITTALACDIVQDEYDLATDLGMFVDGLWTPESPEPIPLHSEERIKQDYGTGVTKQWPPKAFARIGSTRIRLSHAPTVARRVEYPYSRKPVDPPAGTLAIDAYLRPVYALGCLAQLYHDKFDRRFKATFDRYELGLKRAFEYETRQRIAVLGRASGMVRPSPYGE